MSVLHPVPRRMLLCLLAAGLTIVVPAAGWCAKSAPAVARAGDALATGAAQGWAGDAALVYVENDEDLDDAGAAGRWGYLFYSASLRQNRAYSVRDGRIVVAENLELKFEAPPVGGTWIDSPAALQAADDGPGREFRRKYQGRVSTMLLTRAVFSEGDPDQATWTIIYTAPHAPALFVLVDATEGKVRRTWRG